MSLAKVEIPDSLYERLKQVAEEERVTVDQWVASAVAEKIAVVDKEGYVARRARRADPGRFAEAVSSIPDEEPDERDRL
jgi:hypothetical protein